MRRPVAPMEEVVQVYRKRQTATTPEAWATVGPQRRARIVLVSDIAGMNEAVRFELDRRVTHHAFVEIRGGLPLSDFEAEHGSRVLYSDTRNQQYIILRATETGEQGGRGRYATGRLSLSMTDTDIIGRGTPTRA